ncbi:MAG: hypothetical protein IJL42_09680 [Bacteroidales bacterium]|nr:hypothetical protein [Bacteroidales bacterium]MBR4228660.1 hypothetical protein [Bacteroidales bacterium]
MKRILLTLAAVASLLVCACDKTYDDSSIKNQISGLEQRVQNLEDLCSKLNTNIASIQTLMQNIDSKIAIERVVTLPDDEGYLITFSDGASITVYNGLDGKTGKKGDKGEQGEKGDQGDPGATPVVGVAQDGGVLYWTINGEWLLDDEGNKIPVVGPKGEQGEQGDPGNDGKDGFNGADGTTPQLKIEDGKWMVSYDNGVTWSEVPKSNDDAYNTMALTIEETEEAYIITLDGESYTISKAATAVSFQIKVDNDDVTLDGESVTLTYTLTGGDETTHVVAEGSLENVVVDESACTVTIYGGADTEGYIILRAIRNSDGAYSAQYIAVAGKILTILTGEEVTVDGNGGTFEVQVKTNLEYAVTLPDWITEEPDTKAVRTESKSFKAAANRSGAERTATITFKASDGSLSKAVVVTQPEATSTEGDGSLENPFNPAQAIDAVKDLTWTSNTDYEKVGPYYVKGKISRIANKGTFTESGTYGNASFYISEDGTETDEFYCFRVLYLGNKKFEDGQTDIKVGDEVVICGELMNYKGNTPETVSGNAYLYSLNGSTGEVEPPQPPAGEPAGAGTMDDPYNVAAALDAVKDLTWTSNTDYEKTDECYVKGIISRISSGGTFTEGGTYGNASFHISDDGSESGEFYCFRVLYLENKKFEAGQTDIKVGDEVVICGELMNYKGNTPETVAGKAYLYSLTSKTPDEPSVEPGGDDTPTGETVSFDTNASDQTWAAATDPTYGEGFSTTTQGITMGYYKHTCTSNLVAPNDTHVRLYKNSVFVITAPSGKRMKSIKFSTTAADYCKDMTILEGGGGSVTVDTSSLTITWSGSASYVVFHMTGGQNRFKNISVEYE